MPTENNLVQVCDIFHYVVLYKAELVLLLQSQLYRLLFMPVADIVVNGLLFQHCLESLLQLTLVFLCHCLEVDALDL